MNKTFCLLLALLGLLACTPTLPAPTTTAVLDPTVEPQPTETAVSPTTPPIATPTLPPFSEPTPTNSLAPTATPRPSISLGEPLILGRGEMVDAAFLPDASGVAIAWGVGVSLHNLDGSERWYVAAESVPLALDVSPDGERVAVSLVDGHVLLIESDTGNVSMAAVTRPNGYWGDIAFSPDGKTVALQHIGPNRGDPIYLLNVAALTVTEVPNSQIDQSTQPSLLWSGNGREITKATVRPPCSRFLDIETGEPTLTFAQTETACFSSYAAARTPNGRFYALANSDFDSGIAGETANVQLVDAETGEPTCQFLGIVLDFDSKHSGDYLFFDVEGRYLASRGGLTFYNDVSPLIVWDVASGEQIAQLGQLGSAHELGLLNRTRMTAVFSDDDILSLYENGEITSWTFASETEEVTIGQIAVAHASVPPTWSADSSKIAAPLLGGGAAVWDVASAEQVAQFVAPLTGPALSANGRFVAFSDGMAGEVQVYDLTTNAQISMFPNAEQFDPQTRFGQPVAIAFAPDEPLLAYSTNSGTMVANFLLSEQVAELPSPDGKPQLRLVWSPAGDALVTLGSNSDGGNETPGQVMLWERREDGAFTAVFTTETIRTSYTDQPLVSFSPSGNLVAFEQMVTPEASQQFVIVYDRVAGEVILEEQEYALGGWLDEERLLTWEAQYDTRITVWEVRDGRSEIGSSRGGWGSWLSPNGRYSAGTGRGRTVAIGDLFGSGSAQASYGNDILRLSWSPNGRFLAAVGVDGVIKIWPFEAPQ